MKPIKIISALLLLTLLLIAVGSNRSLALERDQRINVLHAAVQIVPVKFEGENASAPWTGSGTIIDPNGLILTNYHVVEENGEWDQLAVALTTSSDQPPQLAFFAEIVAKAPRLDLAVIRLTTDLKEKPFDPATANLVYVPLGDANSLEVGDQLNIFGYPGIGGETITFTQGQVSGFVSEKDVDFPRAWIKTDATIAGGNSGGTAVDETGQLVGIPTKLGAGNTEYFADVRPIQDTDGDGDIDENDTPISLGGFLNSLRPVNLAYPLIEAARSGEQIGIEADPGQAQPSPGGPAPAPSSAGKPAFGPITFASQMNPDGSPKATASSFPTGITELIGFTDFQGMTDGADLQYTWTLDEVTIASQSYAWDGGSEGNYSFTLANDGEPLPEGKYKLVLGVGGELLQGGIATIGRAAEPSAPPQPSQPEVTDGVSLYGVIVDADTGRPLPTAFMFLLQPGVPVSKFFSKEKLQDGEIAAFAVTDENGAYITIPPVPRGQTYGVVIVAEGYEPIAVDDGLDILPEDPDQTEMQTIALSKS